MTAIVRVDLGLHAAELANQPIIVNGEERLLEVDAIVVCAGQNPLRELQPPLVAAGKNVHLIGGADVAAELDAKRAIQQGARLAATI